jgi:hypothetical protein
MTSPLSRFRGGDAGEFVIRHRVEERELVEFRTRFESDGEAAQFRGRKAARSGLQACESEDWYVESLGGLARL